MKTIFDVAKLAGVSKSTVSRVISGSGSIKESTRIKVEKAMAELNYSPNYLAQGIRTGKTKTIALVVCEASNLYYNELLYRIEAIARQKPDIVLIPGYQRGERTDIIRAQAKLTAFRCNTFVARSSYSMDDDERGGCSMIVAPDGQILQDMGKTVGSITAEVDPMEKYMRTAGFGGGMVRNDDFINMGLRPDLF